MPETENETAQKTELKVTVKDAGPARKSLTIEISEDQINEKIESNYDQLKEDALIPGFRKGHAPLALLQKRFGQSVKDDVRAQLLSEGYSQAVEDEGLQVIGEPDVKDIDDIKLPESGSMTFEVEVEVSPEFDLPSLENIKVDKVKINVDDAAVDEEIERYRERFGQLKDVEDATVEEKDYVKAAVTIADKDGETISEEAEAFILVNGESLDYKGHVMGILVEDLGKQIAGKKVGDTLTIEMTGPAGHEDEKIKDQPIVLTINVNAVQRLQPAEVEEIFTQFGMESVDQFKDQIKQMLEGRAEREQQSNMHEQVTKYLADNVDFDLPEGLTGRQTARGLQRKAMELMYQGVDQEEIEQKMAELREDSEGEAKEQLKQFFIVDKAAKQLEIDVNEAEVNGHIAQLAMQQGMRPDKMRKQMQNSGEIEQLYLQIREQKTLDKILESAEITEVDAPKPEAKKTTKKKTSKKKTSKKKAAKKSDD